MNAALVTGGAHRLGRELCLELAERGAAVVVGYRRSAEAASELCGELRRAGAPAAVAFHLDLDTCPDSECIARASACLGVSLNILINNASFFEPSRLRDMDAGHLQRNFQVHCFGPAMLSSQLYAHLEQCDRRDGLICNLCDQRIYGNSSRRLAYLLSKKALRELSAHTALECADRLRCASISPGPIMRGSGESAREFDELVMRQVPLQAPGSATDIRRALGMLLDIPYLNGLDIPVDGGAHLRS